MNKIRLKSTIIKIFLLVHRKQKQIVPLKKRWVRLDTDNEILPRDITSALLMK